MVGLIRAYSLLLLIIFGGVVFHAPLSVFLGTYFPDWSLIIKAWKEILLGIALVMATVLVVKRRLWQELGQDKLLWLIAAFAVVALVLVPFSRSGGLSVIAGLLIDLRYLLFFVLVYLAVKLDNRFRPLFLRVGLVAAGLSLGFAFLQATVLPPDVLSHIGYGRDTIAPYLTIDQNQEYIRINGTLRGPNPLGAYAVIALSLTGAFLYRRGWPKNRSWRVAVAAVMLCAVVALVASFSRSAWLAAGISLAAGLILSWRKQFWRPALVLAALAALVSGGLFASMDNTLVSNLLLHENPAEGNNVNSNDEHARSLLSGMERFRGQPFGSGVGSTGSASLFGDQPVVIENQYLFVAHETGWLGLALFLVISGLVLYGLIFRRRDFLAFGVLVSGIGLCVVGLLLPVWADDTVSLVWWGLAGLALGRTNSGTKGGNNGID